MGNIFISYRRSDSEGIVGRIYEYISSETTKEDIFRDIDSILLGDDFRDSIDAAIKSCRIMLVIIGKTWSSVTDCDGRHRLKNPNDYVRLEIEKAIKYNITIIPVFVNNATIPKEEEIPESITNIIHLNGIKIRHDPDFKNDIKKLIDNIKTQHRFDIHPINREKSIKQNNTKGDNFYTASGNIIVNK